jgi:hypothetical protein
MNLTTSFSLGSISVYKQLDAFHKPQLKMTYRLKCKRKNIQVQEAVISNISEVQN